MQVSKDIVKEWVDSYSDFLFDWVMKRTNNHELSEDLLQETFLSIWQSKAHFNEQSHPKTWLLAILKNKLVDHYRKSYRSKKVFAQDKDLHFDESGNWKVEYAPQDWSMESGNLLDDPQFNRTLHDCLEKLPAPWRDSLVMKFLDERDAKQVCQELNVSTTNYWQILHRAKLNMRKCLELNWFSK